MEGGGRGRGAQSLPSSHSDPSAAAHSPRPAGGKASASVQKDLEAPSEQTPSCEDAHVFVHIVVAISVIALAFSSMESGVLSSTPRSVRSISSVGRLAAAGFGSGDASGFGDCSGARSCLSRVTLSEVTSSGSGHGASDALSSELCTLPMRSAECGEGWGSASRKVSCSSAFWAGAARTTLAPRTCVAMRTVQYARLGKRPICRWRVVLQRQGDAATKLLDRRAARECKRGFKCFHPSHLQAENFIVNRQ